jgi:hypothetical protein
MIRVAQQADPQAAAAEWLGEFRSDLQQFLDDALVDDAMDSQRPLEIPPREDLNYSAFVDVSGGRHDASVIAIGHAEKGESDAQYYVADVVRGFRAPHDPASAVRDFASLAKEYRVTEIFGDAYAADWVSGAFAEAGVSYRRSALNRSALYLEGLPLFVRGLVKIPDHSILARELRLLERRTTRGGRDSVDHGTSGSDDHANALFGMLHRLSASTPADQWIKLARVETIRMFNATANEDDERSGPSYLAGNAGATQPPFGSNKDARPKHPLQPPELCGNPVSDAYFSELAKVQGISLGLPPRKCMACGRETTTRLTDGVRTFCDAGCEKKWIDRKMAEKQARHIAEHGGLPAHKSPSEANKSDALTNTEHKEVVRYEFVGPGDVPTRVSVNNKTILVVDGCFEASSQFASSLKGLCFRIVPPRVVTKRKRNS